MLVGYDKFLVRENKGLAHRYRKRATDPANAGEINRSAELLVLPEIIR
jgi:hypothetical protein